MIPRISIILPTYNGVRYIKRTIESVIFQSFLEWELLIIDDGSTDDTERIVKEYMNKDSRIIYLKNDNNLGIQKTLNKGLREARGEYIARIDDDDEWVDKDKIKNQVKFFESNLDYILVGTGVIVIDEDDNELFRYLLPESNKEIKNKMLGKNCFAHSSVVFKRNTALKLGGYNELKEARHVEDYDLWLKLGIVGKLANIPSYSIKFMQRKGSISQINKTDQFKKNIKLIKNYKNKYPNYYGYLFLSYIKLILLKIYNLLPFFVKNIILKLYKNFY